MQTPKIISARDRALEALTSAVQPFDPKKHIPDQTGRGNTVLQESAIMNQLEAVSLSGNYSSMALDILPDLGIAMDLVRAFIKNPKDFTDTGVEITNESTEYTPEQIKPLMEYVRTFFSHNFDINSFIDEMIEEAMFRYGAQCYLILPPETMTSLANIAGNESITSYQEQMIETSATIKHDGLNLEISSDETALNMLARDEIKKAVKARKNRYGLSAGTEGITIGSQSRRFIIRPENDEKKFEVQNFPLIKKRPMDSVLPVVEPGNPKEPIGFFFVQDEFGRALSGLRDKDHMKLLNQKLAGKTDGLLQRTNNISAQFGFTTQTSIDSVDQATTLLMDEYVENVQRELIKSIQDVEEGDEVEVTRINDVFSLMFSRALAGKRTRVIYVESSLVGYHAYNYNHYGVGESRLEATKLHTSMRISLLFASLYRSIRTSMGLTKVNLTLDDDTQDAVTEVQRMLALMNNMRNNTTPIGYYEIDYVMRALHQSSTVVNIDGGAALPNSKMEIEETERQMPAIDQDFDDRLKRDQQQLLGVPPEYIDQALQGDFAVGIDTSNRIFAMRVAKWQAATIQMGGDFVRKIMTCSNRIKSDLRAVAEEAKIKDFDVEDFIINTSIRLPEPDTTRIKSHMEAYREMRDFVSQVAEDIISENMFSDLVNVDEIRNTVRSFQAHFIGIMMRNWMERQNIMSEASDLMDTEGNNPFFSQVSDYMEILLKNFTEVLKSMGKSDYDATKALERAQKRIEERRAKDESAEAESDSSQEESDINGDEPSSEGTDITEETEETETTDDGGDSGEGTDDDFGDFETNF